jgi:hypothetical protein
MIVLLRGIGGSLHRSQHLGEAASMRFEVWLSEPLRARIRLLLDRARKGTPLAMVPFRRTTRLGKTLETSRATGHETEGHDLSSLPRFMRFDYS